MTIIYHDHIGYIAREVDEDISFLDGFVYFESNGKDFKLPVAHVYGITNEPLQEST